MDPHPLSGPEEALPQPVRLSLQSLAVRFDEGLQAQSHTVSAAIAANPAFDRGSIDTFLTRALLCDIGLAEHGSDGFSMGELWMCGLDIHHIHDGVERIFRLKKATYDAYGCLDVRAGAGSKLLGDSYAQASLFDDEEPLPPPERWVLAYTLRPGTRMLLEISAARVIGKLNDTAPYRLAFGPIVPLPLPALPAGEFPASDEPLELGDDIDDDEASGDEIG